MVRGTVHKACSCLFLSESQQAAVRFLGQPLRADELMLAGAGATLDLFVPNGAVLHILVVEAPKGMPRRALRIYPDTIAPDMARLSQYVRYPDQHRSDIAASPVNHLRQIVTTSNGVPLRPNTLRVSAVVFACQLVERRFPKPTTLSVLSRYCGVSERTLEYGFRQMYDTTPMAYIRSQRLTRNRMALLRAPAHASISQTARAFGFTHMGQYSRDYRLLFGETPSMTLARGNS